MHEGHRERLKERFLENGLLGFADHELLELLLCFAIPRKDTNPLAHKLLEAFGSLGGVLNAHPLDLMAVDGIGKNAAALLSLLRLLPRRVRLSTTQNALIRSPQTAVNHLCALCAGAKTEQFYVLMLNSQHRLKYTLRLNEGTVNQSTVYPRTVVEGALRHGAAAVILAHNHPSGDIEPSVEDIETTDRMRAALASIGIRMLEHFVVGEDAAYAIVRGKEYRYDPEAQEAEEAELAGAQKRPAPTPDEELLRAGEHEGVLSGRDKARIRKRGEEAKDDRPLTIEEHELYWLEDDFMGESSVMEAGDDGWADSGDLPV